MCGCYGPLSSSIRFHTAVWPQNNRSAAITIASWAKPISHVYGNLHGFIAHAFEPPEMDCFTTQQTSHRRRPVSNVIFFRFIGVRFFSLLLLGLRQSKHSGIKYFSQHRYLPTTMTTTKLCKNITNLTWSRARYAYLDSKLKDEHEMLATFTHSLGGSSWCEHFSLDWLMIDCSCRYSWLRWNSLLRLSIGALSNNPCL